MNKKLASTLASLALTVALAPTAQASMAAIEEDSPGFNCYTMGNHNCGASPVIKVRRAGRTVKVAVMAPASDDHHYGSARNGRVIKLKRSEVTRAWRMCVARSESTTELNDCDWRYAV